MNVLTWFLASSFSILQIAKPTAYASTKKEMIQFRKQMQKVESQFDGSLGMYAKCVRAKTSNNSLAKSPEVQYRSSENWYLASTTKVPIAIAILKEIDQGRMSFSQKIILQKTDFVDGSGPVIWKKPGTELTIKFLLEQMLVQSDSTAADMLARHVGLTKVNQVVETIQPSFGPITTLLQVRYDVYGELHANSRHLTNMDFIDFKRFPIAERPQILSRKLGIPINQFKTVSIDTAFENYYAKGNNSATLVAFGLLFERLVQGQILTESSTDYLINLLEMVKTGQNRILAGLPQGVRFAHKTGTQHRRICDLGFLRDKSSKNVFILLACAQKFNDVLKAEKALADVGRSLYASKILTCLN